MLIVDKKYGLAIGEQTAEQVPEVNNNQESPDLTLPSVAKLRLTLKNQFKQLHETQIKRQKCVTQLNPNSHVDMERTVTSLTTLMNWL